RPARFVRRYDPKRDAERLDGFVHRTFQPIDARWLVKNLSAALRRYGSMQRLFARHLAPQDDHVGPAIQGFSETILGIDPDTPARLRKHLARPEAGSACKRLAMYLRWMVRGGGPVDFGLWRRIRPAQLLVPLDTHSGRTARRLGLIRGRKSNDWKAALQLTRRCRPFCPRDPARYDFALFGAGVSGASVAERFSLADASPAG
ncbi:MAG: TIGR02757 family protein, partial [Bacteroidetes bacterium QS_8_68_15]